jgi:hypothetical protein
MKLGRRQKSKVYKIFLQKRPGKRQFGTPIKRIEGNIKMDRREDGRGKK